MSTEAKRPPAPAQKQKEKGAPRDNGADASVNDLAATTPELRRELLHSMLLQRNLLYTAITRAKRLCVLVGQLRALSWAVKNDRVAQRNTGLAERLKW